MRTLIIPDIHNRIAWIEPFLAQQPHDQVVFLGDYWDSKPDTPEMTRKTVLWLRDSLRIKNRKHLWGNHDLSYYQPIHYRCSGWTSQKAQVIHGLMKEDWEKLHLIAKVDHWVISHAGFHSSWFHPPDIGVDELVAKAYAQLDEDLPSPLLAACGQRRGGYTGEIGGIMWLDWQTEFEAVPHLSQIIGHSVVAERECVIGKNSSSWNINTDSHDVGVIEDGNFSTIYSPLSPQSPLYGKI